MDTGRGKTFRLGPDHLRMRSSCLHVRKPVLVHVKSSLQFCPYFATSFFYLSRYVNIGHEFQAELPPYALRGNGPTRWLPDEKSPRERLLWKPWQDLEDSANLQVQGDTPSDGLRYLQDIEYMLLAIIKYT